MHQPSSRTIQRFIDCRSTSQLIALLEKNPELIDDEDETGSNVFSRAVGTRNIILINWLLKKGVNVFAVNQYGQTALHRAFVGRAGEIAALLYFYEKQIPGNPMEIKNDFEYMNVFLVLPEIQLFTKEWHDNEIRIFRETMDELCRSGAKLPEASFKIAIEHIDRLNRESRSLSDSSGGSGAGGGAADSTDSGLRHRGGGSGGSSADEKESAPLLAETTFRDMGARKLSEVAIEDCGL